jgi:hypothetical protein
VSTEANERLKHLLERREKYFLLEGIQRRIYQTQFELIQKEIMQLKLHLEIYEDELDLVIIEFDYSKDCKVLLKILEDAQTNREVWWVRRIYDPASGNKAKYIGQVKGEISDPWLKEVFLRHQLTREGLIDCPWPTSIKKPKGDETSG